MVLANGNPLRGLVLRPSSPSPDVVSYDDDDQLSHRTMFDNSREGALYGNVSVGEPPKVFKVMFDTGESFSWLTSSSCIQDECLNRNRYNRFNSSKYNNHFTGRPSWKPVYGGRSHAIGILGSEEFNVSGIQVRQTFGAANYMTKHFAAQVADGVLGLAFHPLKWPVKGVKSFLENALDAKHLTQATFSLFSVGNHGEILFGGIDYSKFTGDVTYLKVTTPDSWRILIDDVIFIDESLGMAHNAYVDTGSNILLAPHVVAEAINDRLEAKLFKQPGTSADGLWVVNCSLGQSSRDLTLGFSLNGVVFELSIADIVMEGVGKGDSRCFSGIQSTDGPYWVLGAVFIQNYYLAFDNSTDTARIGIARLRDQ
ncbi:hypothetical protein EC968_006893 [Mortierella alpina]|nr:hypothetical protein EC968_006893 [Mortierella alpina]